MTSTNELPQIVQDVLDAIHNDKWMYICVWGEPRTGKSTFCMKLMNYVYKDWNKVLGATVFSLNQILYNMKHGIPERWPTVNQLHMRIPILNWDDFAAHSGKAKTQHEKSWDVFKGAFDTLGTKIGVLLVNMVSPRSPTQQLMEKYTHEIWIPYKGHYKYDKVMMRQDYGGWNAHLKKNWIDEADFDQVPIDIFKQYDEMRMGLADEVLQSVEDSLVETHMDRLVKIVQPIDVTLLKLIREKGLLHIRDLEKDFGEEGKNAITRLKSRGLIVPVRVGEHWYKYDIQPLGSDLLKVVEEKEKEKVKLPIAYSA
jgi:hypothetical protein